MDGTTDGNATAAGRGWRSAGRLIRHEARILRNGSADAFAGWRDRILITIVLTLAALWLRDASLRVAPRLDPRIVAGAAFLLGWLLVRATRRRLLYLETASVLVADALNPKGRRIVFALLVGLPASVTLGLAGLLLPDAFAQAGLGMAAGAIAAVLLPLGDSEARARVPQLRFGGGPLPGWRKVPMAAAAGLALATALFARLMLDRSGENAATIAFAAGGLAALSWLIRPDDEAARFLAMTGRGPWRSAALQLAPAAAFSLVAFATTWLVAGLRPASLGALATFGTLLLALMRSWLFRLHTRRLSDTILTLGVAAAGLVTAAAPSLGLLVGLGMAVALYRRSASATWRLD